MPEETEPNSAPVEQPALPGTIHRLESGRIAFDSSQRDEFSGLPRIMSVWTESLTARAQAVADQRGVQLATVVQEWEAAWAVNG